MNVYVTISKVLLFFALRVKRGFTVKEDLNVKSECFIEVAGRLLLLWCLAVKEEDIKCRDNGRMVALFIL